MIVLRRCATMKVVRPARSFSRDCWTSSSVAVSTALVASSSMKILGSARKARAIGAHEAILCLQEGYQTDVGERGANLSLGQRQLICFTRAFLADPRIFMLDEATSAVDTATELAVQHCLEKLLAGRTTFVVAHRLSTIKRADCILVIEAGRIIERGNHAELLSIGGKYAHLYRQFVQENV